MPQKWDGNTTKYWRLAHRQNYKKIAILTPVVTILGEKSFLKRRHLVLSHVKQMSLVPVLLKDEDYQGTLQDLTLCCWLSRELPSKVQIKICHREESDRYKIHRMDKIFLELATFKEIATTVRQNCFHYVIPFVLTCGWNQRCVERPRGKKEKKREKTPFQKLSGINSNNSMLILRHLNYYLFYWIRLF